jgi:hypothetical protein
MELYIRSLRAYGKELEQSTAKTFPLAPVILDMMERSRSLSVSVMDWNKVAQFWELAFTVPDLSSDDADSLIEESLRQNIKRQGEWIVARAAEFTEDLGYNYSASGFNEHVLAQLCDEPYWKVKSIQKVQEQQPKFRVQVEVIQQAVSDAEQNWILTSNAQTVRLLGPPADANIRVWGLPGRKGLLELNASTLRDRLEKFAKIMQNKLPRKQELPYDWILDFGSPSTPPPDGRPSDDLKPDDLKQAAQQGVDIKDFCDKEKEGSVDVPIAYYDAKHRALYGLGSAADMERWLSIRDDTGLSAHGGKLRMALKKDVLAQLLAKTQKLPPEKGASPEPSAEVKALRSFPYPILAFSLQGRELRAGIAGAITLEGPGEEK